MKKGTCRWYERNEQIKKLISQGLNGREIELRLGLPPRSIYEGLKILGITMKRQPLSPPDKMPEQAIAPQVECVYIDVTGLKVTRYAARYAEGALMQSSIIRSRR